jgi:hypothetical protein
MMEFFFLKNTAQYGQSFFLLPFFLQFFIYQKWCSFFFFPIIKNSQKLWILAEKNTDFQWKYKFCKFF